jgi:outer membrane receptor for ferrienterochelin and colicins
MTSLRRSACCLIISPLLPLPLPLAAQQPPDTVRVRHEAVLVESTRTGRRLDDVPLRIEVVDREEIEEKLLMTPGDIAMLLNETGGVRVQPTAPSLGGAAVRIQGLRGRYAQLLADGLPLYGEAAGLGALQIPPMDLARVEVIKGAASALYGAAALGGVINLLSRRPDGEHELLFNATSRGGLDAVAWLASAEAAPAGWTLVAGVHRQPRVDVSGDGWADIPHYERVTARPRLFLGGRDAGVMLTLGVMAEDRLGGVADRVAADGGAADGGVVDGVAALDTRRADVGAVGGVWLGAQRLAVRASAMEQRGDRRYGARRERELQRTLFGEAALSGSWQTHAWVAGAALHHNARTYEDVPGFDDVATIPGVFVQDEWSPASWFGVSASVRADHADAYGTLVSPRLAALLRPGEWTLRVSAGAGHHVPGHWIEDVHAIGLGALAGPSLLDVERARAASIDIGREVGPLDITATAFGSIVDDALALRQPPAGLPVVVNVAGRTRTWGAELLARAEIEPVHATLSYAYTRAREPDPDAAARREVALTPRHAVGVLAAWEHAGGSRIGAELYHTGAQALHDDPWRTRSRPYTIVGVLAEQRVGTARVFVNFENIGDVRQTRFAPLLLPQPTRAGRRTTDAWAPLDGRVINAGVRLDL